jgi:nitrite reductase/ring-hydroxylating ferredoxin subunit
MSEHHTFRPTRRSALTGVATVGLGVPLLAACGGGDSAGAAGSAGSAPAPGTAVAATGDIEVGGGTIFADESLVITQPTAGEFKGFSSICTHQGCPVTKVADGLIDCTCHGSKFSITDGAPQEGPATEPLATVALTVTGDQITVA